MTRRAGAPALGVPWWNDIDPPGVGGNPVLIDLHEDEEPTLADYVALDGPLGENQELLIL